MVCCTVTKRTSFTLCILFAICGVISTGTKGYGLLKTAEKLDSTNSKVLFKVLVATGVILGFLQCYFVFVPVFNKNIDRILRLDIDPKWHQCYRWQLYVFLVFVVATGVITTKLYPDDFWVIGINGCLDTMVCIALSFGSVTFYNRRKELWYDNSNDGDVSALLA